MARMDRLSALPDDIIHNIIALLPIDDSVRTSVLSSRWSLLCLTNPDLHFSFSERFADGNIISFVDHCLMLSPIRKLRSVHFPVHRNPEIAAAVRRWIRFASYRDVEDVVISSPLIGCFPAEIPMVLFQCRSLSSLKLQKCVIRSVPVLRTEEEELKFLKTVVLAYVEIRNVALYALISLCPMIETLALSKCSRDLSRIVVYSSTLRSLTVNNCDRLKQFQVVWAPRLSRLMYDGDISRIKSMVCMKNLEEAAILSSKSRPSANRQQWKQIITALAHVKVLSVNSWFFEFPLKAEGESGDEVIFHNLKEFHWFPVRKAFDGAPGSAANFTESSICDLISALQHCPVLELLCIHCDYYYLETEVYLLDDMFEASCVQERGEAKPLRKLNKTKLPCLKKVKVVEFSGKKEEVQLIKLVLSKAAQLESVIVCYVPDEKDKLEEMRMVIGSLPKASRHARVSLSELPNRACKHDSMWSEFMMF